MLPEDLQKLWDETPSEDSKEYGLIPKGQYKAELTLNVTFGKTVPWNDMPCDTIKAEFTILDDESLKGRKLWQEYRKDIENSKAIGQYIKFLKH